jgi:hypothetical protein
MQIDDRVPHLGMAEQQLDRSDVIAGFEQMSREGMAQRILTLPMNRPPPSFTTGIIRSTANM